MTRLVRRLLRWLRPRPRPAPSTPPWRQLGDSGVWYRDMGPGDMAPGEIHGELGRRRDELAQRRGWLRGPR